MALRDRKTGRVLSQRDGGLECPRCGCCHFRTVYVRHRDSVIERRKECRHCDKRVTTYEKLAF